MSSKRAPLLPLFLAALLCGLCQNIYSQIATKAVEDLGGTTWQLVKFQGGADKTLTPEDKWRYTIRFSKDGTVDVRIDCNHGHGSWSSSGPQQIEFSPLALTRAMCPQADLTEHIAKDWQNVRSYVIKDGHLFLTLMADGGTYEFESPDTVAPGNTVAIYHPGTLERQGPAELSCSQKTISM